MTLQGQPAAQAATPERTEGYAPIRDYAAIGNGRSVALVARDGAIDWLCVPGLDGALLFAALLDPDVGGRCALQPAVPFAVARAYEPETNVLSTTFETDDGVLRLTDALTLPDGAAADWCELARLAECVAGEVPVRWVLSPHGGFHGARDRLRDGAGLVLHCDAATLALSAWNLGEPTLARDERSVSGEATLREGEHGLLALDAFDQGPLLVPTRKAVEGRLDRTRRHWRAFAARCDYDGPWREAVVRSALTLELLFQRASGAMAAAASMALPEAIGGQRNFDYRLAWLRDMDFALDALLPLGYREQVNGSLAWGLRTAARTHPRPRPFYRLDGRPIRLQRELPLRGYLDTGPVLEGNGAAEQLQLGNFGNMLNTAWNYVAEGNALDAGSARQLAELASFTCEIWRHEDSGIWELPRRRHYTQSKIGCWLALDRARMLAERGAIPRDDAARWRRTATEIRRFVQQRCFSARHGAFAQAADGDELDASLLLAPRTGFLDAADPRTNGTIDAIRRELGAGGPLLWRTSRLRGREGAFVACSFWLAEALAIVGRASEALETMEAMLAHANDVGLYAEEIDPASGAFLGNTPQALSHLTLASAAQRCAALAEAR